jgi:hypothetical protein
MAVSIADQFKILPTIPRRTGQQINRAGHPADKPSQFWQRSMYYPFMDYRVSFRFDGLAVVNVAQRAFHLLISALKHNYVAT